ncbi:adenylate/guanylate cyclase domain-containing protein [Allocoleopsis sp.]|uniref:CHASE2 domain-containing protein n=1 Tax=Allocoleopsis sp. TaxID=3088169 RepID=UPI002FD4C76D
MNFQRIRSVLSVAFLQLPLFKSKAQGTTDRPLQGESSTVTSNTPPNPRPLREPNPKTNLLWEWRGVWIVAPTVTGFAIALRLSGWLQPWEWMAFDQYMRTRPLKPAEERIVIVAITEADLRKVRQWPIPDTLLTQLLQKVKAQKPRVIGLDLYRDLPVKPGYSDLVKVFETTPNLIGIEQINEENPDAAIAPPPVLAKKNQVGVNNLVVDADGKLRRGVLAYKKGDESVPSFSMLLAGLYLEQQNILPQPTKDNPQIFQWGKSIFRPFQSNDGGYVGADDGGYQFLLNYREPANSFRTVTLTQVLNNEVAPDLMRDRLVLIGSTATSLNDFFYTPYSGDQISTQQRTAGVEIQANIINHILSAALEGHPTLQTWSEPVEGLWIFFWSGVGAILTWHGRYAGAAKRSCSQISLAIQRVASPFLAAGVLVGITYVAFWAGWWIPLVPPLLTLSLGAIAITAYTAHAAGQIRKAFGRYLDDRVVAKLLESPGGLKIGGEKRTITMLTSDLRGFTALAERLTPEEVVKVLNLYLKYMTEVIAEYQGTIDDFLGDGILVLFGAPTLREDDSRRAVACAVAMQLAMDSINEKLKPLGCPKLEMGIGINTGEVVVGNIGSEKRTKYSAIGSHVNLTFRIETYTVGGQIFISESTLNEVESIVRINGRKEIKPKGVKQAITIYNVEGIGGEYNLFLSQQEEDFFPLPEEICLQFHYALLDGKHISDSLFKGSLVKLSAKGAMLRSENGEGYAVPEPLSNIKLNLLTSTNTTEFSEDMYAKVLDRSAEKGSFYIHFTAKPPHVEARLNELYQTAKTFSDSEDDQIF